MIRLFTPPDGPIWLRPVLDSIVRAFKSIMDAPFRLWPAATADLPPAADYSYGLVYDLTTNQLAYSTGSAWNQLFGSGNAALNAIAALTPAADRYVYFTSASAAALGTVTAFARTMLDDADAAAVRTTIDAQQADAQLAAIAGLAPSADQVVYWTGAATAALTGLTAFARTMLDDADAAAVRATIDAQQADSQLAAIAGLAPSADQVVYWTGAAAAALTGLTAFGRSLIDDADAAAGRTTLGLGTAAVKNVGTSGDAVPVLNGAATSWASGMTISSGALAVSDGAFSASRSGTGGHSLTGQGVVLKVNSSNSNANLIELQQAGTVRGYFGANATGPMMADSSTTVRVQVSTGGADVTGELRCDSFRIDQTPTAATPTPTHTISISANGTTYRIPCVI